MDAHTECNDGWLEPLLARIAENRKAVVTPIIEFINGTNFALKNFNDVNNMYGTFDWNLFFVWYVSQPFILTLNGHSNFVR